MDLPKRVKAAELTLAIGVGLFAALVIYDIALVESGARCELYLHPVNRALRRITGAVLGLVALGALTHVVLCALARRWRRLWLDGAAGLIVAGLIYASLQLTLFHCLFYGVDLGGLFLGPR